MTEETVEVNRCWPDAEGDGPVWQVLIEVPLTGTGRDNAGKVGTFMEAMRGVIEFCNENGAKIAMRDSRWEQRDW